MADPIIDDLGDDVKKRFWAKVNISDDGSCWLWKPKPYAKGYGRFHVSRKHGVRSHRLAYLLAKGTIPDGWVVDHICKVRNCCNPNHLRAITHVENVMIGSGVTAENARKTHCHKGHELAGRNLVMNKNYRNCRQCKYDRENARRRNISALRSGERER